MADVYNPDQEEENQPGQVQQIPSGSVGAAAPGGDQPGAGQTMAGTGQGGQSQQRGSGRFTNIQKYLKANQGSQIGQQLGQKIEEEAKTPLSQMGSARDELQKNLGAEQQRLGGAGDLFNKINTQFGPQQGNTMYAGGQAPGPNNVEGNGGQGLQQAPQQGLTDEDYASFAQLRQGQAIKPEVGNLAELEAGASKIGGLAEAAGTEQGRFGLLNQFYGRPTYNTGQQRLDQLLLQGNAGQAKALQTGAQQAGQQTSAQLQALKDMQTQAQSDIGGQALARQQEAQSLIGKEEDKSGLLGGLRGDIETRATTQQGQADAARAALTKALSGEGFGTQEEIDSAMAAVKAAGIDPSQFQVHDLARQSQFRPEQFLNQMNITPESVASEQDRAKMSSLYKLAGVENPTFLQGPQQSPVDLKSMLNSDALNQAGAQRKAEYQSVSKPYASTQEFYKAITSGGSPAEMVKTLQKYGLSPENANMIMTSQEVAGRPSGPGMHAEPYHLDKFLFGNTSWSKNLQDSIAAAASGIKKDYSVGTTLQDLLGRYKSIPTQGTGQMGSLPTPVATGPGGQMGLF